MPTKLTCFACSTIDECPTCGQKVEREGITYDLLNYDLEIQAECVVHSCCPECGSHRVEW